jgi:hypothetical protein
VGYETGGVGVRNILWGLDRGRNGESDSRFGKGKERQLGAAQRLKMKAGLDVVRIGGSVKGIIAALEERGLASPAVVAERIMSWPTERVLDAALGLFENLDPKDDLGQQPNDSLAPFNFIASSTLSGLSGCREWTCRMRRSELLARYAALYSDTLVIPWRLRLPEDFEASEDFRYELVGAILSVLEMRPVIEAGIIRFVLPEFHFCNDCASTALHKIDSVREATKRTRHAHEASFYAEVDKTRASRPRKFSLNGPEDYVEHGGIVIELHKAPSWAPPGLRGRLPKRLLRKSGLVDYIFDQIAKDLIFHQLCTAKYDAKLLTALPGEAEILSRLSLQDKSTSSAASLCARLTHEVPLMSDVPISRVLKIRKEEPTAFLEYRLALSGIMKEYVEDRKAVNKIEARQIFENRLLPELIRLRRDVETHRRKVRKKSAAAAAVTMLVVTLGLTAGLHASEFAAIGSGTLMGGLAALLGEVSSEPDTVRNHQLYFLLKLAKASSD